MNDETSDIAYSVSPLPNCGELLAMGACDGDLRIFDLENSAVCCCL
jgi:hypothetical protein